MEEDALQGATHTGAGCMDVRPVVVELPKEEGGSDGCHSVSGGDTDPNSVSAPEFGEDEQEGNEKYQLAAH